MKGYRQGDIPAMFHHDGLAFGLPGLCTSMAGESQLHQTGDDRRFAHRCGVLHDPGTLVLLRPFIENSKASLDGIFDSGEELLLPSHPRSGSREEQGS